MKRKLLLLFLALVAVSIRLAIVSGQEKAIAAQPRNIVIFVSDGLRNGSVNEADAPTYFKVQSNGVNFANSHSLFPTFTTANASAIATGHYFGDTGDFSNAIYAGYPLFDTNNFGRTASTIGTAIPFLEDDQRLGDLDSHFNGSYL